MEEEDDDLYAPEDSFANADTAGNAQAPNLRTLNNRSVAQDVNNEDMEDSEVEDEDSDSVCSLKPNYEVSRTL